MRAIVASCMLQTVAGVTAELKAAAAESLQLMAVCMTVLLSPASRL